MTGITLWQSRHGEPPTALETATAISVTGQGQTTPLDSRCARPDAGFAVVPIDAPAARGDPCCAVLLVSPELGGEISLRGVRRRAGMHRLRHGDSLQLPNGLRLWISASHSPERATYDPVVHGEDLFCFLTKARLEPGAKFVVCPGQPATRCGVIYSAASWAAEIPCHACGHDPRLPTWRPESPTRRRSIAKLMTLARRERAT